ncbi:hypothetical protein POUND7_005161, partial [Theobroma cacao]
SPSGEPPGKWPVTASHISPSPNDVVIISLFMESPGILHLMHNVMSSGSLHSGWEDLGHFITSSYSGGVRKEFLR